MNDANNTNNPSRPLSEISHLFLSSLREQTGGENRARPVRIPPGQQRADATPSGEAAAADESSATSSSERKRVTAMIGAHLNGQMGDATLAYAASIAASGVRVGVITVDATEFKLQLVECNADVPASEPEVSDLFDQRQMTEAALELNHDVDRWLLVVGDHRRIEARALLAQVDDWTMLCTCDHDGIVSGYRTLKGLAESAKAPLAIALIDAPGDEQAERAFAKLAGVCRQFLDWDVEHVLLQADVESAQVHTVLWCHSGRDKAQVAAGPQWRVVQDFLELEPDASADLAHYGASAVLGDEIADADDELEEDMTMLNNPFEISSDSASAAVANQPMSIAPTMRNRAVREEVAPATVRAEESSSGPLKRPCPAQTSANTSSNDIAPSSLPTDFGSDDVVDLPDGVSILSAVLRAGTQLLATPIAPPMCPGSTVAIGRDRGLVLVAQAGSGLAGMDAIASAVRWLDESKQLIAMAMPQLAIDAAAPTQVQLLIDHADRTAEGIRPLLGNSRITIRSYRRLRWAGRTGLLLDAA